MMINFRGDSNSGEGRGGNKRSSVTADTPN